MSRPSPRYLFQLFPLVLSVAVLVPMACNSFGSNNDGSDGPGGETAESSGGKAGGGRSSGGRRSSGGQGGDPSAESGGRAGPGGESSGGRSSGGSVSCILDDDGGCVECLQDDDCAGRDGGPFCDVERKECVECLDHSDCSDPQASRCSEAGECVPCVDPVENTECAHIEGKSICDTSRGPGECVECTVQEACDAGNFETCDLFARGCVPIAPGERATCEPCSNDLQCESKHCVAMTYQGQPHGEAGYCLTHSSCTSPYGTRVLPRVSVSGQERETCQINEEITTCEAVLALMARTRCGPEDPPCPTGGLCRTVSGDLFTRCTIPCSQKSFDGGAGLAIECLDRSEDNYGTNCAGSPELYCGGPPDP
jgi:hypothetical protein